MTTKISKVCKYCGRLFSWRKKWELNWESVQFCSSKCRNSSTNEIEALKVKILDLLKTRGRSKSICPSEILDDELKSVKSEMEKVRCAARLLAYENLINITQKGKALEPSSIKGPIRLKLK